MSRLFLLSLIFLIGLAACRDIKSTPDETWPESVKSQLGQTYEILWTQSTETGGDTGSTGSSSSRYSLTETVLAASSTELVLEYDLPAGTSDIDRRRSWQFPARVKLTPDSKMALLNADELKLRNDDWLAWGNYDQSHCGKWFFTWTAQKIECDPNSVIGTLENYNIRRSNLTAGAPYASPLGVKPAILTQETPQETITKLTARLELDPEKIRQEKAKANLILAQMLGEDVPTLEEEMQTLQKEKLSGTLEVTFILDHAGEPIRKVQVSQSRLVRPDGLIEISKSTETIKRRLLNEVKD